MKIEIDVADFAEKIKSGKGLSGKDGALTDLVRQITEMMLQAELESHLAQDLQKNRKNGHTSKTMRTEYKIRNLLLIKLFNMGNTQAF